MHAEEENTCRTDPKSTEESSISSEIDQKTGHEGNGLDSPAVMDNYTETHSNGTDLLGKGKHANKSYSAFPLKFPTKVESGPATPLIKKITLKVGFKKLPCISVGGCKVKLTRTTSVKKSVKETKDKTEDYLEVGNHSTLHPLSSKKTTKKVKKIFCKCGTF